jgi:hypothetical protein
VKRASNDTLAGRRYLDLQREAKRTGRPTDELIQLYALECFLDRLVHSKFAETFILKGGVLLAALDARRPTRDIDFAARAIENTTEKVYRRYKQSPLYHLRMAWSSIPSALPPRPSARKIATAEFV